MAFLGTMHAMVESAYRGKVSDEDLKWLHTLVEDDPERDKNWTKEDRACLRRCREAAGMTTEDLGPEDAD